MNLTPAVIVNVQRQPGANIIAVVDRIKALLPRLQASLPASVKVADSHRSHHHDSRVGRRRAVRADADGRAGRDGHLPVPAQPVGDDHPQHRGAALADRHVRRDVPARLQPGQPVADGADDLDRLRGRRRDRDDRKHLALHRGGRQAAGGRAQGRRADRLHDPVADRLADRGADSAAVHGRHRRPAVPRVRGHAGGDDPGVGGGVADADADDVREAAAAYAGERSRPGSIASRRRCFNDTIAFYGRTLRMGSRASKSAR